MVTPILAPSLVMSYGRHCVVQELQTLLTFTYYSLLMLGRYDSHLSPSQVCCHKENFNCFLFYLLLIIPALRVVCLTSTSYLSMNNQHEKRLKWNTICKVCHSKCLQSGLAGMSEKTNSIGFLSAKNGLDGCVNVSCTQGWHNDSLTGVWWPW